MCHHHPNWKAWAADHRLFATLMKTRAWSVIEAPLSVASIRRHRDRSSIPEHHSTRLWSSPIPRASPQLGWPDMKLPLLYCLSCRSACPPPGAASISPPWASLSFKHPDQSKYPCIWGPGLRPQAQRGHPCGADECGQTSRLSPFPRRRDSLLDIPRLSSRVCDRPTAEVKADPSLSDVAGRRCLGAPCRAVKASQPAWPEKLLLA